MSKNSVKCELCGKTLCNHWSYQRHKQAKHGFPPVAYVQYTELLEQKETEKVETDNKELEMKILKEEINQLKDDIDTIKTDLEDITDNILAFHLKLPELINNKIKSIISKL